MVKKPPKKDRAKADKELSDLLRSPEMQQAFQMQQRQREIEAEEEAREEAEDAAEAASGAMWNRPKPRGPHD
jgi:hypothetical protein